MNMRIQYYHPDSASEPGGGEPSTDEHAIDQPLTSGLAGTRSNAEAEEQASDEDDTILGLGPNHEAGGLSGDGERTDEYDAAVMGIGD